MLSKKCKYAIRAVIYLASQDKKRDLISGTEIAKKLDMPIAFTVKILQELAKKNIIHSVKGPRGGFFLTDESKAQPVISVVKAIDDLLFFHNCGIGLSKCSDEHPCPFHTTFKEVRDHLYNALHDKKIGDFCSVLIDQPFYLRD